MPAELEPIRRFACTFKGCSVSFETEKGLRSHKKYSHEYEYCDKCQEDFECFDDLVQHKITRPKEHNKACRVCGEEFKSDSGLRRHIELNHKVDQKLTCIGCQKSFYRACLFIEHLEFGHCEIISASQFQGHVVHKHLIIEFLKGGPALERFNQKMEKFDATQDYEHEGGIDIEDPMGGDDAIEDVKFEALKPSGCDVASTLDGMTLSDPSEFSIAAPDYALDKGHGINILRNHFWDPLSSDWNAERFFDSVMNKYACPFICEQTFDCVGDLNGHILGDHRITRMKCPKCLKYYKSATALMSHCEARGSKCEINKTDDYNIFLDRISGGFLGVDEKVRPDHVKNPQVIIRNDTTDRMEVYTPPVATYLQYKVTTPPDWKEPRKVAYQIGGFPKQQTSTW